MNSLLIVIHMVLLLISCQNRQISEGKTIFKYNSPTGISSLDPAFARTQENIRAVNQLFNGLVQLDEALQTQPCIAKSWNISENGKVYSFTLRNDVLFHKHPLLKLREQQRVTAHDFVYSFERIMDPETASDGAWIFNGIVDKEHGFTAVNDTTLEIKLVKAFAPFLQMLSMSYCSVVPEAVVEQLGDEFGKRPIGTGPFQFSNWLEGVRLNLVRNPNYFEASAAEPIPYLDAVSISFVQSKQTSLLQFKQGQLDIFTGLESAFKDELLTGEGTLQASYKSHSSLVKVPFLNTEYLAFQMQDSSSPFFDIRLRRAINLGIDRQAMVRYLRNNIGRAADGGFIPMGLPTYDQTAGTVQNKALAKELVAELLPSHRSFTLTTTKDYLDLCVLAQNDLKSIGLELSIDVVPSSLLKQQKSAGELPFFRSSWIADYPDGENYMACFYSPNEAPMGPNYTRYKNEHFDALYEQLITAIEDSTRKRLTHQMEMLLKEDLPFVLLFYDESIWLSSLKVEGLRVNSLNQMDLRQVRLTQ